MSLEETTATEVTPIEEPILERPARVPYWLGLDGLRAIAVLAVLIYHADVTYLSGGFLGVEVFFVISGFLITSLLLIERQTTGHVTLKRFWWRRARRLLPALFFLLLLTLVFAEIFLPDEVASLRGDVLAAITYITNWNLIYSQRSYFETIGRPPLLQHLWSLAVEEQFYIIWPVLFSLGMAGRWRRWLPWAVVAGIVASTVEMALLYQPDADPSRLYYGTDTRAAGLLVGVGLAFLAPRLISPDFEWRGPRSRVLSLSVNLLGLAGLGTLLACFATVNEFQAFLYQGGFLIISLSTAALIFAAIHPLAHLGVWLNWRPLRWVGLRSYSIYLWHWPIYCVTRPQLDIPLDGLPLLALRFGLTGLLAEISYRYVETPLRQGALERLWRGWRLAQGDRKRQLNRRWAASSGIGIAVLGGLVISAALAKPPQAPDYTAPQPGGVTPVVAQATATAQPTSTTEVVLQPTPLPAESLTATALAAPTTTSEITPATPEATPTPIPTATPKPPPPITAVGDSILLGAGNELHRQLGDMIYEADVGLQAKAGVGMLQSFADQGQLGPTVIIMLGTNGYFSDKSFDDFMAITGKDRRVFFVNVRVPREWQNPNNKVIASGVARYPNTHLIDWYSVSAGHSEYFGKDGVHLTAPGIVAYTRLIAAEVK